MTEKLNNIQHEIITGLLLGDGHLHKTKKISSHNASLVVARSIRDSLYLKENFNFFQKFCRSLPQEYLIKGQSKTYSFIRFQTRSLPVFSQYYNIWYPKGHKIVPAQLQLTPQIIAIWLADDGNVSPKSSPYRLLLRFSSEGFSGSENEFLANSLSNRYQEKFHLELVGLNKKGNKKYRIVAHDYAARPLLKEIDPFFPASMIRKAYWRKPEARFYINEPIKSFSHLKHRTHPTDKEKIIFSFLREKRKVSSQELETFLISTLQYSKSYSKKLITRLLSKHLIINIGSKQAIYILKN